MPDFRRTDRHNTETAPAWFKAAYLVGSSSIAALRFIGKNFLLLSLGFTFVLAGFVVGSRPEVRVGMGCIAQLADGTVFHYRSDGSVDKGHLKDLNFARSLVVSLIPKCTAESPR